MEILVPPLLRALQEVQWRMKNGRSMSDSVQTYLSHANDPLATRLRERWTLRQQGAGAGSSKPLPSPYQRAFWELIERGSAGQPVLEALAALETEVEHAAEAELEAHLSTLPFKMLIPLLLFQFPAHLLLLLGPLLRELNRQMGGG